jgi:hypothetical protein
VQTESEAEVHVSDAMQWLTEVHNKHEPGVLPRYRPEKHEVQSVAVMPLQVAQLGSHCARLVPAHPRTIPRVTSIASALAVLRSYHAAIAAVYSILLVTERRRLVDGARAESAL